MEYLALGAAIKLRVSYIRQNSSREIAFVPNACCLVTRKAICVGVPMSAVAI